MSNFFEAAKNFKNVQKVEKYFLHYNQNGEILKISEEQTASSLEIDLQTKIKLLNSDLNSYVIKDNKLILKPIKQHTASYSVWSSVNDSKSLGYECLDNHMYWPSSVVEGKGKNFVYKSE